MTDSTIARAPVTFDGASHSYYLDGEKLAGVSTVAKIGDQDAWGIASAWGFRIGYEGAYEIRNLNQFEHPDELRAALQKRGLTPWGKRDAAGDRGTWVHDVLEGLATSGTVDLSGFSEESLGHAKAVCQWYVDYRPEFVATEVQLVSAVHRFAGRYDVRCLISARRLVGLEHPFKDLFEDHESPQADRVRSLAASCASALTLDDLKTAKGCYPTSHFPQLSGYELASVEMGFPATDAQFVLNTHPDGTYDFIPSWSTGQDFLDYLSAHKAIKRIKDADPQVKREQRLEKAVMDQLPRKFADLLPLAEDNLAMERGQLLGVLKSLKKRGVIEQDKGVWQVVT